MAGNTNNGFAGLPDVPPRQIASSGKRQSGPWLWVLVGAVLVGLSLVAVVRLAAGTRLPEVTEAALDDALVRWQENGPNSYRLEIEIEGQRPGIVTVEVEQDVVTKMTRDGQTPSQSRTWSAWAVPGMFDTIERELEMAADPVGEMGDENASPGARLWLRGEFDPTYGYPAKFHRAVLGGGPEVYWQVTRFEVL